MSDVMILSERNPYAKTVWLTTRNTHGENRFQVLLELDGKEEVLEDTWVPCLDSSEGVHLHSHQLSNLFNGRDEEIAHLKALLKQAEPYLDDAYIVVGASDREKIDRWIAEVDKMEGLK